MVSCQWVGGALVGRSVVGGLVDDLWVGSEFLVVDGMSVVGRFVIRQ